MKKVLLSVLVLLLAVPAYAANFKEMTADMVDVASGRVTGKVAMVSDKIHFESYDAKGKLEAISIVRMDQKKVYALMEYNKTYIELPVSEDFSSADLAMVQTTRTKVGSEKVGDYMADKYEIKATVMGFTTTSYEWIAPELSAMPIRTSVEGVVEEMRNIKFTSSPASLFELPSGYKHDPNTEGMIKEMMASSSDAAATGASTPGAPDPLAEAAGGVTKDVAGDVGGEVKDAVTDNLKEGAREGVNSLFKGLFKK